MKMRITLGIVPIVFLMGCYDSAVSPDSPNTEISAGHNTTQIPNLISLGIAEKVETEEETLSFEEADTAGEIQADGVFDTRILELVEDAEIEQERDAPAGFQARVYSPDYTPGCTQLNPNTTYTLSGTTNGTFECFYFETTADPVKVEGRLYNQQPGNDHDLLVAQDDPDNPYTFPFSRYSALPGNADERVQFISDAGHYYIQIETIVSDGAPFSFELNFIEDFDEHELNDTIGTATTLTSGVPISGNIDSPRDIDFYEYSLIGTELVLQLNQDEDLHVVRVSFDEGQSWSPPVEGSGRIDLTSHLGSDTVLIGVLAAPSGLVDTGTGYTLGLWDDEGMTFSHLQGQVIRSYNRFTEQYYFQKIPGFEHTQIQAGVHDHYLRFFGQLRLSNGEPAVFRRFEFGHTKAAGSIGSVYHLDELITDINGFFTHYIRLYDCHGYRAHFRSVPGLDPDLWFLYDRERYEILAMTPNGEKVLNTSNEYFHNICEVRENNSTGALLNSFTYD